MARRRVPEPLPAPASRPARRPAPEPVAPESVADVIPDTVELVEPAPEPDPPVDVAVAALLETAGVAEPVCLHSVKRTRYKGGRWTRYCEACNETWGLEGV